MDLLNVVFADFLFFFLFHQINFIHTLFIANIIRVMNHFFKHFFSFFFFGAMILFALNRHQSGWQSLHIYCFACNIILNWQKTKIFVSLWNTLLNSKEEEELWCLREYGLDATGIWMVWCYEKMNYLHEWLWALVRLIYFGSFEWVSWLSLHICVCCVLCVWKIWKHIIILRAKIQLHLVALWELEMKCHSWQLTLLYENQI